jgi:hypothetical protein
MVKFAFGILSHLEDQRIQTLSDPSDGAILLRQVRALILIVRTRENLLRLFKADPALRIRPQHLAFARIEVEARWYNCYTIIAFEAI